MRVVLAKTKVVLAKARRIRFVPVALSLLGLSLLPPVTAHADSLALILNGIPGSPDHEARFREWTEATREALVDDFGFSPDDVVVLTRPNEEDIRGAFGAFGARAEADDVFYLFLIGHGSYDGEYKFNIARADLTAADYAGLIDSLGVGRSVVINATTSSGGSIDALKAPNRVVVTATRTGSERNDTVFYQYFLEGLTTPTSDEDLNERLSVWEAFRYAAMAVTRHYEEQNLIATEHPQISDNGGDPTGVEPEEIPTLAQLTHLNTATDLEVEDPVLRGLLEDRNRIEGEIAALRANQETMTETEYDDQLEALLVELALKNQEIRAQEGGR
jgi:hypothetical protein